MTTLRQRMIDGLFWRGFRPRTQVSYRRAVSQMARHYHRSPELITDQEVQAYLLHLVCDRQLARTSVNQVSSAAGFLICDVLGQADRRSRIPMALTPQRLPEVLSRAEVAAVLAAPISLKGMRSVRRWPKSWSMARQARCACCVWSPRTMSVAS
jgi:integrase/recombinase XerD